MLFQFLAILLIGLGEAFSILAELIASKGISHFGGAFLKSFAFITLAGALLIGGYMVGYLYLKNIWIVAAISIAAIAIIEPLVIIFLFHEKPTTGAVVGLVLGIAGVASALLIS